MVIAVSSLSRDIKPMYKGVRELILSEDIRRRSASQSSSGSLLNMDEIGRRLQNGLRDRGRLRFKIRSQSRSSDKMQRWNCHKVGHFRTQCVVSKVKKDDNSVATASTDDGDSLMCYVEFSIKH